MFLFLNNFHLFSNLKSLKLDNLINCKNKEFIAFLLEENSENLEVTGTDHLSEATMHRVIETMKKQNLELENILKNEKSK